jgi:cytochrome d ubiquinol oxidase subunit II
MEVLWFCIVAFMLAMYVILDGFDLGAGIIHLFAAKSDTERRTILNAIGPVWDGNEVWLLAAGGTLYFAFPQLYATSFSGFYLPLMMVLWLLMLRGLGIEFRHRVNHLMWKAFWDAVFAIGSILLAIFFGAALGNVVRGVPLDASGYFFEPLWTTFTVVPEAGILDWFTVVMGLVAFCTLAVHGSNYVAVKTEGVVQSKARAFARIAWWGVVVFSVVAFISTSSIHPEMWDNFAHHVWGWIFPALGVAGLAGMFFFNRTKDDFRAFLSSAAFIAGMLASTAFGMFPILLRSSLDPKFNLTVWNSATHEYGMSVAIVWWTPGILLAMGYFTYIFRKYRGKLQLPAEGEGY